MNIELDYSIINVFGETIQEGIIEKEHSPIAILDLHNYQDGSYFIRLQPANGKVITQKVVLIRD